MALYLIVGIAGERVALPAAPIDSVVEIGAISPVPRAPARIAGLAALRSRVLTIVDSRESLGLGRTSRQAPMSTVVVAIDGNHYGLLVDKVVDIVAIEEAPRPLGVALDLGWAHVARGIIEHLGEPLLLLDPVALIAGGEVLAA